MTVAEVRRGGAAPCTPRDLDERGISAVEEVLVDRVDAHGAALLAVSDDLHEAVRALGGAARRGKRLRAAFCLWGARGGSGGTDVAGGVEAAAALELFHLAALVHDDLMDRSDDRRGEPTVHRRFADAHRSGRLAGDPEQFGAAVAVLAGDLCLTWSDDLLADAVDGAVPGTARRARAVWSQLRDQVIAGQYLDVLGQASRETDPRRIARVVRYKSAKYTVEQPLLLGGALAGAAPALLERYSAFGLRVGEAFQLRDDVLGVFGDPAVTGKPAVDDIREGKRTLLVAYAEERAGRAQRLVLERHLGDPASGRAEVAEVREVLVETGALQRVEDRIVDLVARAGDELAAMPVDPRTRHALGALTDACAWRAA